MTILGISIGTTRTGVCVLKDGTLLDRYVHSYHYQWSDHKLRIIVNRYKRYILKHNVTAIIVKVPPLKKHTPAIARILKRLEALAKDYDCEFDLTTKSELKHSLHARSTNELILLARHAYPELAPLFEKGAANDHRYYKKLYEAVAAAHFFQGRLLIRAEQIARTTE
jgi:RNase H-fold protein (predicted Holliday junction resolvase)